MRLSQYEDWMALSPIESSMRTASHLLVRQFNLTKVPCLQEEQSGLWIEVSQHMDAAEKRAGDINDLCLREDVVKSVRHGARLVMSMEQYGIHLEKVKAFAGEALFGVGAAEAKFRKGVAAEGDPDGPLDIDVDAK